MCECIGIATAVPLLVVMADDLDLLFAAWRVQRKQARKEMVSHLDSAKYREFVKTFGLFVQTPKAGARQSRRYSPD